MGVLKPSARPRRFGLGDMLILTAALALAIAFSLRVPAFQDFDLRYLWTLERGESWISHAVVLVRSFDSLPIALAVLGAAAVLAMRLRQPRPAIARLARQPGFIACSAAVLIQIIGAILLAIYDFIFRIIGGGSPLLNPDNLLFTWIYIMATPTGLAVIASWFTLALGRRWRSEPTWLDRAGRLLGLLWLLIALVNGPNLFQILGLAIE